MLTAVQTKYGIEFPLVDLFQWGEDAKAAADIQEAMLVGASKIDGQMADHYAFRQDAIDWQIWIAQGEAPLPLRYVITTKDEPGEPQYMANLTWDTQASPLTRSSPSRRARTTTPSPSSPKTNPRPGNREPP